MKETRLSLPELGLVGATRGILGLGLGILLAGKLPRDRRVLVGTVLAVAGALSTIPLGARIIKRLRKQPDGHAFDDRSARAGAAPMPMPS